MCQMENWKEARQKVQSCFEERKKDINQNREVKKKQQQFEGKNPKHTYMGRLLQSAQADLLVNCFLPGQVPVVCPTIRHIGGWLVD